MKRIQKIRYKIIDKIMAKLAGLVKNHNLKQRIIWHCTNRLMGNCTPNQTKLSTHFWKILQAPWSKLSEKLKTCIKILLDQAVLNNWKIARPTKMFMPIFSFSDNLLQENHINFSKKGRYFWNNAQNILNFGLGYGSPYSTQRWHRHWIQIWFWPFAQFDAFS